MQTESDPADGHAFCSGQTGRGGFDLAEAERFLATLDGDNREFVFAAGDDDRDRRKRLLAEAKTEQKPKPVLWRHRRGSCQQVHRWIEEQQKNGWGIFVSVQAMSAGKCRNEELCYIRTVYAEMDIGEPLKPWPLEPSIIVETSPGRYHVYWLILADNPITAADFHGIMMCLVEVYGSDPDAKDLARRLRLPGSLNLKPGREPHPVKVIHESGARYPGTVLVTHFRAPPRPIATNSAARPKYSGRTPPGLERFVGKIGDGPIWSISPDPYGDWVRVGMALHAETGGGSDGLALWDRWSAASGSDKYAAGVCDAKWESFGGRRGISGGTIFSMARERGWAESRRVDARPMANGSATKPDAPVNGHTQPNGSTSEPIEYPDPVPLPSALLPVAAFDYSMLPRKLQPWVEDIAARMQCPADYVAVTSMVALGTIIGRKLALRPKLDDNWSVVANLWGLCIGPPGVMKSPAQDEGLKPLRTLAASARAEYESARAEWDVREASAKARHKNNEKEVARKLAKDAKAIIDDLLKPVRPTGEEPVLRRFISSNSTYEALAVLMQQNRNGILVDRDEALALVDRLDEEGHADERGFYLSGWNGNSPYTVDRIGRGLDLHVEAVCISMIGGTQPARISQYIAQMRRGSRHNDGLVQRYGMMVWPDISPTWENIDRRPDRDASNTAFKVFERLDQMDWRAIGAKRDIGFGGDEEGLPFLRLSEGAHDLFVAWRTNMERRLRSGDLDSMMESHLAKFRKHVPALALIIHLADAEAGEVGDVGPTAMGQALQWAAYLETHAARVYASGGIAASEAAHAIVAKVKSGHLKAAGFSSKEVWRPQWSRLRDRDMVRSALKLLEDYDWLVADKVEGNGRTATIYRINPKVLT